VDTLQGKQALITGGSRGFGCGIAEAMLDEGQRVAGVRAGEFGGC
jgi:NAD(P)-dependent dehydrogenase (short-subunit alcohol dehydrogenase family)